MNTNVMIRRVAGNVGIQYRGLYFTAKDHGGAYIEIWHNGEAVDVVNTVNIVTGERLSEYRSGTLVDSSCAALEHFVRVGLADAVIEGMNLKAWGRHARPDGL